MTVTIATTTALDVVDAVARGQGHPIGAARALDLAVLDVIVSARIHHRRRAGDSATIATAGRLLLETTILGIRRTLLTTIFGIVTTAPLPLTEIPTTVVLLLLLTMAALLVRLEDETEARKGEMKVLLVSVF